MNFDQFQSWLVRIAVMMWLRLLSLIFNTHTEANPWGVEKLALSDSGAMSSHILTLYRHLLARRLSVLWCPHADFENSHSGHEDSRGIFWNHSSPNLQIPFGPAQFQPPVSLGWRERVYSFLIDKNLQSFGVVRRANFSLPKGFL